MNIMNKLSWTRPYFGVSHLNWTKNGYQTTITQYSTFTEGYVLQGFKRLFEVTGDLSFVKQELERKSQELQILA
jgi:hypothetical protein